MLAPLRRLPASDAPQQQPVVKTGTDDAPVRGSGADQMLDQNLCAAMQTVASASEAAGAVVGEARRAAPRGSARKNRVICEDKQAGAEPCLIGAGSGDIVAKTGPSTQVD